MGRQCHRFLTHSSCPGARVRYDGALNVPIAMHHHREMRASAVCGMLPLSISRECAHGLCNDHAQRQHARKRPCVMRLSQVRVRGRRYCQRHAPAWLCTLRAHDAALSAWGVCRGTPGLRFHDSGRSHRRCFPLCFRCLPITESEKNLEAALKIPSKHVHKPLLADSGETSCNHW